ncbi:Fatty acid desaturase [Seminavis robusta]|uniref:Fatty acid desaturase n=1 Tax=Seminavis robusta TaxID=568900 RepID=A0A9N8HGA1_9STRA|nr:Fatty acid desaturase [Seminavis robusta]|eukprot:Sro499_g155020.1 Fatty acid desaturase (395) ;mRNA; f:20358-21630
MTPTIARKSTSVRKNVPVIPNVSAERWKEITGKYPHFPTDILELTSERCEAPVRLPAPIEDWLARNAGLVHDPRDGIMISLVFNITCAAGLLYALLWYYPSHWLGLFTQCFYFAVFETRFILMKHYAEHQRGFSTLFGWYVSGVLSTLAGLPPGLYGLHHLFMHHIGNNAVGDDLSATECYQRDNILHWLVYCGKHYFCMATLPMYAFSRQRPGLALASLGGTAYWVLFIRYTWSVNKHFAIWALIVPFCALQAFLMFGNFCQHIFVHPKVGSMTDKHGYEFNCAIAYQSINHFDNLITFNDGYHVTHHVNSRVHWTRHPEHFLTNLEKYVENDTLVINGLGVPEIGFYAFTGRLDIIADHVVHFTKEKRKKEDVIADLKLRLQPIVRKSVKAI